MGSSSRSGFSGHETDAPVEFDAGDIDEDRQKRRLGGGVSGETSGDDRSIPRMLVNYDDESALTISRITAVAE